MIRESRTAAARSAEALRYAWQQGASPATPPPAVAKRGALRARIPARCSRDCWLSGGDHALRHPRRYPREASTDQYFLAGKSLGWFTVGAAVFTSNAERPRDALHGVQFQPLGSQPATRVRQSLRLSAPIGRRPTIAST